MVVRDSLDGSGLGQESVPGPDGLTYPVVQDASFVEEPPGVTLLEDTSYVSLDPGTLDPVQGTILVTWQPVSDLLELYASDHPEWTGSEGYPPPRYAYALDTVGWMPPHPGAFALIVGPGSFIQFGLHDGGEWRVAAWQPPAEFDWAVAHELGATYGPAGLGLIVDCQVRATAPFTGGVDVNAPWFLGQAPWNEPYGPHTMVGTYSDLRIHHDQIGLDILSEPTLAPSPVPTVEPTAEPTPPPTPRPTPRPRPTPTPLPAVTAAERYLLRGLPFGERATCVPRRANLPEGTVSAIDCTPSVREAQKASFYLMAAGDAMAVLRQRMDQYLTPEQRRGFVETCEFGKPGRLIAWALGGAEGGLICYLDEEGRPNLRIVED